MKKTALFTALLLTSAIGHAQRHFNPTNGSWNYQNTSIEVYQNRVIAGFTEINPVTGLLAPAFRITTTSGTGGNSFNLNWPDAMYLMDFTVNPVNQHIILTGMTAVIDSVTPYKMWVMEIDFAGNPIPGKTHLEYTSSGNSAVPQQVIYSQTANQVVVVGTEMVGLLTTSNYLTIQKSGFALVLDGNDFSNILCTQKMDSPQAGSSDNDMFESVTEVPGNGYFIGGSANNPTANEQNIYTMGMGYGCNVQHSRILDNTNNQAVVASVMYSAANAKVYVLANNSASHTYQVGIFDAGTGVLTTPMYSHVLSGYPVGSGIDVNGFRLQQEPTANRILVSGYITSTVPSVLAQRLTPFQITLEPTLTTVVTGKLFQSGNNSTLAGYYNESGNSVYINTPDMAVYNPLNARTYLVNPNTINSGYDLHLAYPVNRTNCEKPLQTTLSSTVPVYKGPATHPALPMYSASYPPTPSARTTNVSVLCQSSALGLAPETAMKLFPNPAKDYIEVETETGIATAAVYDMQGHLVLSAGSSDMENTVRFNTAGLTPGVYLIRLTDSEGTQQHEKFIKE